MFVPVEGQDLGRLNWYLFKVAFRDEGKRRFRLSRSRAEYHIDRFRPRLTYHHLQSESGGQDVQVRTSVRVHVRAISLGFKRRPVTSILFCWWANVNLGQLANERSLRATWDGQLIHPRVGHRQLFTFFHGGRNDLLVSIGRTIRILRERDEYRFYVYHQRSNHFLFSEKGDSRPRVLGIFVKFHRGRFCLFSSASFHLCQYRVARHLLQFRPQATQLTPSK